MSEFEWLRQMRQLRRPLVPQRDLWSAIDTALDDIAPPDTPSRPAPGNTLRRRWLAAAGLAASIMLVGGIVWRNLPQAPASVPVADITDMTPDPWKPADPRLSGAAIELDAARMELQLAMQLDPGSAALQRLLDRTMLQQDQLRQLARQPG